jgi:hypothetical protein
MAIDVKNIGAFGVSFSRGMNQTWVNMYRREQGFAVTCCAIVFLLEFLPI